VYTAHTRDTPWSTRPWTLYDLFFIKPLLAGPGNIMGFSETEKKAET